MQAALEPKIDLIYQIIGKTLPVDHGFALFGAISRLLPEFHDDHLAGLALIRGRYLGDGLLGITPRTRLTLRLPISGIPTYLRLAGKSLDVAGHILHVGVPQTKTLIAAPTLYAHVVTTKNGFEQARFDDEVNRQLASLDVRGKITVGKRRTFSVHGRQVVGYSLLVSQLTDEGSIFLQREGIGGRRRMGCGFFEVNRP